MLSLESDSGGGGVGNNGLVVTTDDVFVLNATSTGVGTSAATATLLFRGADVGISAAGEEFDAIALVSERAARRRC